MRRLCSLLAPITLIVGSSAEPGGVDSSRTAIQQKGSVAAVVQPSHHQAAVPARGNLSQRLSSFVASRKSTTKGPIESARVPSEIRSQRSSSRKHCEDWVNWKDSDEDTCEAYKKLKFCNSRGGYGSGWHASWGTFADFPGYEGHTASQACCACGGGLRTRSGSSSKDQGGALMEELPPPPPVRRTRAGCECMQSWSDDEYGLCDKACCNLDNDDAGDWCVVKDADCQGGVEWGYCVPSEQPAPPIAWGEERSLPQEEVSEWKVVAGRCELELGGCITSPVLTDEERLASPQQLCAIAVPKQSRKFIEVFGWELLGTSEMMRVNGKDYAGPEGPNGVLPSGAIWWTTNAVSQLGGWKICPKNFAKAAGRWSSYDYACLPSHGASILPLPGIATHDDVEVIGLSREDCRALCTDTEGCSAVTFWSQSPTRCLGLKHVTAHACLVDVERSVSTDIFSPKAQALRLASSATSLLEVSIDFATVLDAILWTSGCVSMWLLWRRLWSAQGYAGMSLIGCNVYCPCWRRRFAKAKEPMSPLPSDSHLTTARDTVNPLYSLT